MVWARDHVAQNQDRGDAGSITSMLEVAHSLSLQSPVEVWVRDLETPCLGCTGQQEHPQGPAWGNAFATYY